METQSTDTDKDKANVVRDLILKVITSDKDNPPPPLLLITLTLILTTYGSIIYDAVISDCLKKGGLGGISH
jgi:hypothetical protein